MSARAGTKQENCSQWRGVQPTDPESDPIPIKNKAVSKGSVFNTAITLNTNIFTTNLSPTNSPTTFRIYCCFVAGAVLSVQRTRAGVTVAEQLNAGGALAANACYTFDILVESGDGINLQYAVTTTASILIVIEIPEVI